jgi:hypothetical protein
MELMIAAAKGARIHAFIRGQSLIDLGAPNGEAASLLQIVGSKNTQAIARRIKLSYPAP